MECRDILVSLSMEILGESLTIMINEDRTNPIYDHRTLETDKIIKLEFCLIEKEYEVVFLTNTINTITYDFKMNNSYLRSEKLLTFTNFHKIIIKPSKGGNPIMQLINKQLYLGLTYYLHPSVINGKGCLSFSQNNENVLPTGMSFNPIDGSISGKLTNKFVSTIGINCVNGDETVSGKAVYVVDECPPYSVAYELKIISKLEGMKMIVLFGSSNKNLHIIYGVPNNKEYVLSGCFQYRTFKLALDSSDSSGWGNNEKVVLTFGNGNSNEYTFSGGNQRIISDEINNKVVHDPKWMYSDKLETGWNNNFDSIIWKRTELSKLPQVGVTTRYYRIIYESIVDYELLDSLLVTTTFKGGMVFYVNGEEITRKDLALPFNSTTEPLNNDLKSNYQFEISGNLLRNGINYIGVEIHLKISFGTPIDDEFRIKIVTLTANQKCSPKTLFTTMNPTMIVDSTISEIDFNNTIDLKYSTSLIGDATNLGSTGKEIIYKYPVNIRKSFNEYSIATTTDCPNRDLKSWEVLGDYLGDGTYNSLSSIDNGSMEGSENSSPGIGRSKLYSYKISGSKEALSAYKLKIKSIKSMANTANATCNNKYGFSEFYVSNCKESMCDSDFSYSPTRINTKSYKICETGKIGRKEKVCELEGNIPTFKIETVNCNSVSPSISYTVTEMSFSVGLYKEYNATLGQGEKGYLEVVGELPDGVVIDEITGRIFGIPMNGFSNPEIYIIYDFLSGINLIPTKLSIKADCKNFK